MSGGAKHPALITWLACALLSVFAAAPVEAGSTSQPSNAGDASASAMAAPRVHTNASADDLSGMSLEQLMQIPVSTTDTLTKTDRALVPAAITSIDRAEIDQQNPRTLQDLLEIYVPNMEWVTHQFEIDHVGIRGIIGDRNDKYLLLVNGREMNQRTHEGVLSEMDLYLNGDLGEVDVVRGPGSATYGPGAVEGVISLQTLNGLTFQGTDVTVRGGALDEFYSFEFRHGEKLSPDSGWFIYAGAAQVTGASSTYAPIIQGQNWTDPTVGTITAGHALPYSFPRQDAEYQNYPQIKAHLEYDSDGLTLWTRYTRGGETIPSTDRGYAPAPIGWGWSGSLAPSGVGYQQLTTLAGIKKDLGHDFSIDASTSIDFTDYERKIWSAPGSFADSNQEQKWITKGLLNWTGIPHNELAGGFEYGYYWLGRPSWMSPSQDGLGELPNHQEHWYSDMLSYLAEDQWHITKQWTLFLSGRADKDKYTDWLLSPRVALAWQPTAKDTLKGMFTQSLRTNTEEAMRQQWESVGTLSSPEKMNSLELRYERQQNESLFLGASIFYDKLNVLGWNSSLSEESALGWYKTAGVELEATYRTQNDTITFSHGYTKLVGQDFSSAVAQGTFIGNISPAGYGYGYDLTNWANNVTKLSVHHQFDRHVSADGNIEALWGFPGNQQLANYENAINNPPNTVPGYNKAWLPSVYLNLGCQYDFGEHSTLRLDAYNVLGWIDQTLNKREIYTPIWQGVYRVEAPAFALTYKYAF